MILTIDIGNTNITCGLFKNDNLMSSFRISSDCSMGIDGYKKLLSENIGTSVIKGAVIGSVVDEINDRIFYALKDLYNIQPMVLSSKSNMSIKLTLQNNEKVGADRIANVIRAWELYKKSVIVVDFGTATTFDIINSDGEFIGGLIAPGIKTQLDSLSNSTSKLPKLEINNIKKSICDNTEDAILSGVIIGSAAMIDGMLDRCEAELKDAPVIIGTGGLCSTVSKYMKRKFDTINPNLTLEGLLSVYYSNISE